ncbi:uncharacterized protein LOC120631500 [Pararge aegeria]|nr:uncharacterized protein LOC120631500 [Pararge aegeria]
MRLHAFLIALCVCAHNARAASIALDNVDFDDDHLNVVNENLRKPGDIPVKVVEGPVLDENSNDYVPSDDISVNVKRIEVDLENPGEPQRQEHETQNPENFSDNDKIVVAIRQSIEQAENVFNEGLKHVSDSFKTFSHPDEDLPLIQKNIKNLKENFNDQFEKLNKTIRAYLKPQTFSSGESMANPKLEIVQAHLKYLDDNFKLGLDTLTEGVEVYSIIKEEDEAEKAIALKADLKAESEVAPAGTPSKPAENPPAQPTPANTGTPAAGTTPWNIFISNLQNSITSAFTNLGSIMNNGQSGTNGQGSAQSPGSQITDFWQNIFQGQNTVNQKPPTQEGTNPANTQADPVPAQTPAPWGPQSIIQSIQSSWNNNPIQQAYQNFVSLITPQTPPAQQPAISPNPTPAVAVAPEKVPERTTADKPVAVPTQGSNVVPAPVNEQPQADAANPVPPQTGPIQQLVQNNPIIKGIQSAVQRIQGTPNPETPREEIIKEDQNKEEIEDPKGHYHGGYRPDNSVANQGDSSSSGRVEEKVEEKVEENLQVIPAKETEVLQEEIKAEEMKTPPVSDKTE